VLVCEVVMVSVELAEVGSVARAIRLGVVGASEDWVRFVLVQEVGVEEAANTGRSRGRFVTNIVCALLYASSCADSGIKRPKTLGNGTPVGNRDTHCVVGKDCWPI